MSNSIAYEITCAIAKAVISKVPSPFIFTNGKTVANADFGICPLMRKVKGKYTSKVCPGCYSCNLINVYASLKGKIESLPSPSDPGQLEKFEESLKMLRAFVTPLKKLRFYSFGDFDASHMPYIRMAAKYFEVDIISKALTFPQNEEHLRELLTVDNVFISLSFNPNYIKHIYKVADIIKDSERAHLNYTINYEEENPDSLPFRHLISVWHLKNDRKRYMLDQGRFETLNELNTCGMFDGDGNRNTYEWKQEKTMKRLREKKGSCHACNNCRCSLKDRLAGMSAKLPDTLTA